MKYYYLNDKRETIGPVDVDTLKQLLSDNTIHSNTQVVAEGESTWTSLGSLPDFKDTVPPPPPGIPFNYESILGDLIGKLLSLVKKLIAPCRIEWVQQFVVRWGHASLLVTAAIGIITSFIGMIRESSHAGLLLGSTLLFLLLIAIGQWAAKNFLGSCKALLASTETRTSSSSMYDVFGFLWLLAGLAAFLFGLIGGIEVGGMYVIGALVLGTIQLIIFLSIAGASFNHGQLNIQLAPQSSAGEEAVSILSYGLKLLLFCAPLFFGLFAMMGALVQTLILLAILFSPESIYMLAELNPFLSAVPQLAGLSLATSAALLPLVVYILFLVHYLILDVIRAIVSIPGKLDKLAKP